MKLVKKIGITMSAAALFAASASSAAFAARLEDVSVQFSIGEHNDTTYPKMDVIPMEESLYSVESAAFVQYVDPYTNRPNRYPTAEVVLKPADGYTFKSSSESYFNLFGGGAEYLSARKSGDSSTLTLTVEFENMGPTSIGLPASVSLDENGLASWTPVGDAGSYEVTIMRNGKANNPTKTTVTGTSLNIGSLITKTGDYSIRVSAVSRYDAKLKSDYAYSDSISVDDSLLAKFASDAASYAETSGQWIETENGCWYQNPDGTWPASGWQQIDGNWYFFNAQGYRQTGWVLWNNQQYYCDSDGKMLASTTTPDGYYVDANGVWKEGL